MSMTDIILNELKKIEETHNVKILYAVESGSRAWGFESPDSDYDVRFIYVREKNDYLRVDELRDVIELPIDEVLDINGWDLKKTFKLSLNSNPRLLEWCNSPVVYRTCDKFIKCKEVIIENFSAKALLHHYMKMSLRHYSKSHENNKIKAKRYFYILNPILSCRWIMKENTPPPVLFADLRKAVLCEELNPVIDKLLELKVAMPEGYETEKIPELTEYIEESYKKIERFINDLPENNPTDYSNINKAFLDILG